MNTKILNDVASTRSRLKKEHYLKACSSFDKKLLCYACDPMTTFGVTVDEDMQLARWNNFTYRTTHDVFWSAFCDLCDFLISRKLTGNAALNQIDDLLVAAPTIDDAKWACRILNKDLKAGVSVATLNNVFPKLLEPFAVALATPYDADRHDLSGHWIVEPKLDGLRMVIIDGVPYTRNGRKISSADFILKELQSTIEPSLEYWVLDGEIMGVGSFDEASGTIRRKDESSDSLVYNVFDIIHYTEWVAKQTSSLSTRKYNLKHNLTETEHVKIVQSQDVPQNPTITELFTLRDSYMNNGYEGAMLKDMGASYAFKRSNNLLKLKSTIDADVIINNVFEGRGKYKGQLGGVIVFSDTIGITRVGSGFSDTQRTELWARRNELIGECVEVRYQELTKDNVMRFPIFLKFRQDK